MFTTVVDEATSGSGSVDFAAMLSGVDAIYEGSPPFVLMQGLKDILTLMNHLEGRQDELMLALHDWRAVANIAKLDEPWNAEECVGAEDCADRETRVELEAGYGYSRKRAQTLLHNAHYLGQHPALAVEVTSGRLERSKAQVIYFAMCGLAKEAHRRLVVEKVLPGAGAKSHAELRREVEKLVLELDPKASQERHKDRVKRRGVKVSGAADSSADVTIYNLPADQAVDAFNALDHDARAAKKAGDKRGLNQLRADLAVARITGRAVTVECNGHNCEHQGRTGCDCTPDGPCGCGCNLSYASDQELRRLHDLQTRTARSTQGDDGNGDGGDSEFDPEAIRQPLADSLDRARTTSSRSEGEGEASGGCGCGRGGQAPPRSRGPSMTLLTLSLDRAIALTAAYQAARHAATRESGVPDTTSNGDSAGGSGWASGPTDPEETGITRASIPGYGPVSDQPAWLAGFGPLLDTVAFRLLQAALVDPDARIAVAITHPVTGRLLQYHPIDKRFLSRLQREAMQAGSGECLFTTCHIPAIICDADHGIPFEQKRETHLDNMNPLCPSHHATKTHDGFQLTPITPGEWQLKMRSGHTYTAQSPPLTTPEPLDPDNDPPPF